MLINEENFVLNESSAPVSTKSKNGELILSNLQCNTIGKNRGSGLSTPLSLNKVTSIENQLIKS